MPSSDITATGANSSLSGTVTINTPDIDPSSGLLDLPVNLSDATRLVASACRGRETLENQFTVTGRGGLPPSPQDAITDEATWFDLRERVNAVSARGDKISISNSPFPISNAAIVEAQGWLTNAQGEVILTPQTPTVTPQNSGLTRQQCYAP